ncbi:MAG TPA: hypothetical protein VHI52_22370, partial [Verrucomicrobiae bacterium]|nr:hypothetical protein [Verrucomicrobiae bacterium]
MPQVRVFGESHPGHLATKPGTDSALAARTRSNVIAGAQDTSTEDLGAQASFPNQTRENLREGVSGEMVA